MSRAARDGGLAVVMPMAGRGSRFREGGRPMPKPLIDLAGRPFFAWAVDSIARTAPVRELVFVVLEEHVTEFDIEARVLALYPEARVIAIPEVTAGAAETAAIGVARLETSGPFAVNDCDHAFVAEGLGSVLASLGNGDAAGALLGFRASSPSYSYVRLGPDDTVTGTVEKEVVSPFAIAGCYLFADADAFAGQFARYRADCPYGELFLSGVYNTIITEGGLVLFHELARHLSFGTPAELERASAIVREFLEPA
ncbi:MAG: NTP transferase domain-containing protein [Candidatus Eremiobacteraeota bacterium]|nr:NTP transferase domain-containing protein [Candidatus Eremiobacteraeota bacterium]